MSMPEFARAVLLGELGEPALRTVRLQEPLSTDVTVAVEEIGLTSHEYYASPFSSPTPVGHAVTGRVIAVGSAVADLRVGERVTGCLPRGGAAAEVVVADAQLFVRTPHPGAIHLYAAAHVVAAIGAVESAGTRGIWETDHVLLGGDYTANLTTALLRSLGEIRTVTVLVPSGRSVERALHWGATSASELVGDTSVQLAQVVSRQLKRTDPELDAVDVGWQTEGDTEVLQALHHVVRSTGVQCVLRRYAEDEALPLGRFSEFGGTLVFPKQSLGDDLRWARDEVLGLMHGSGLDLTGIETERFAGFENVPQAFDLLRIDPGAMVVLELDNPYAR